VKETKAGNWVKETKAGSWVKKETKAGIWVKGTKAGGWTKEVVPQDVRKETMMKPWDWVKESQVKQRRERKEKMNGGVIPKTNNGAKKKTNGSVKERTKAGDGVKES